MSLEGGSGNEVKEQKEINQRSNEQNEKDSKASEERGAGLDKNTKLDGNNAKALNGDVEKPTGEVENSGKDAKDSVKDASAKRAEELDNNSKIDGKSNEVGIQNADKTSLNETSDKTRELAKGYYDKAGEVAPKYEDLRTYSDHREQHVEQVADKSQKAADVIEKSVGDSKGYSPEIDRKELQVAALWHDTGMDGGDFRTYDTGKDLRGDHSLNSAIHALEKREDLKDLGVNPDRVAVDCMAHSKSCSGVDDLTSKEQWTKCFDRIDSAVKEYNEKHTDNPINFDKSSWTDETRDSDGNYNFKDGEIEKTASTTAALRLGDANRDAPEEPYTQGGENISVDRCSYNKNATDFKSEVETADVTLTNSNGEVINLRDEGVDSGGYGRMFAAGEGNLSHIDCEYNEEKGSITEKFVVNDGSSFPYSTQECITERLKELDTIKGTSREAIIEIEGSYSPEQRKEIEDSYSEYCEEQTEIRKYKIDYRFKEDEQ